MGGSAREERWEGSRGRTGTLYGEVNTNSEFESGTFCFSLGMVKKCPKTCYARAQLLYCIKEDKLTYQFRWLPIVLRSDTRWGRKLKVIPEFCIAHSYCARILRHQRAHMSARARTKHKRFQK